MMQHVLKTLKTVSPEITMAYFRQDNAACYRSCLPNHGTVNWDQSGAANRMAATWYLS